MKTQVAQSQQQVDAEALALRLGSGVPRYTSYPTAPHFNEALAHVAYGELLDSISPDKRISLYLHIPFCDRLCWFCGCNTKHTLKYEPVARYVGHILSEMAQVRARLGFAAPLEHIHFGGGSPSYLRREDLERLGATLRDCFVIDEATEISLEIDPSDVSEETLQGFHSLGVTRVSVGVQDFDEAVQKAINRPQTFEQTRDVIEAMRGAGVASVNVDALYGLPLQTAERLEDTIRKVISLEPDRIALFGYAHVPWMKKHQKLIRDEDLPGTVDRFRQAQLAENLLWEAGYLKIGIDHFARPGDSMAVALEAGALRRNFQGYTTDVCDVLLGLGGSSISKYPGGYVQNLVATARYEDAIAAGDPPCGKGLRLSRDDQIRAYIIEELMCRFELSFDALRARFGAVADDYIAEAKLIADHDADGLCSVGKDRFQITCFGRTFARVVAAKFDAYFGKSNVRYSKAV